MRKSFLFSIVGLVLGVCAPSGALLLLWFSPHPALSLPYFIVVEWRDHAFFFTYMLTGSVLSFGLFGYFLGRGRDVVEAHNRHLALLATQDELTGLGNHRFLHETLKVEFRRHLSEHLPISCLMLDLDHFKKVNDAYGHPFGDYVLRHFAALLKRCVRDGDVATRYGGEEFLCILPHCGPQEAREVAQRIRQETERCDFLDGEKRVPITVSVGVATSQAHGARGYHQLIELSDQALYRAKRQGRNKVVQVTLNGVKPARSHTRTRGK